MYEFEWRTFDGSAAQATVYSLPDAKALADILEATEPDGVPYSVTQSSGTVTAESLNLPKESFQNWGTF